MSNDTEMTETDEEPEFDLDDPGVFLISARLIFFLQFSLWIIAILMIMLLMFMEKRKRLCKQCLSGYYALIVPVNFLECRKKRKAYLAVYALISLTILDMIKASGIITKGEDGFIKIIVRLVSMMIVGIQYLPALRCIYVTSIPTYCLGLLYTMFIIAVEVVTKTPNPTLPMERLISDLILRSCITIIAGSYIIYWFVAHIFKLIFKRGNLSENKLGKSEMKYVKHLLTSQKYPEKNVFTLKEKTKMTVIKDFFKKHVYSNVPGFKYSLTILLSCLIGFISVTKVALQLLYMSINLFDMASDKLNELAEESKSGVSAKIPNVVKMVMGFLDKKAAENDDDSDEIDLSALMRTQIIVILVAVLLAVILSYILNIVLVCRLLVNYRTNVLNFSAKKTHNEILDVTSSSNITVVMSGIQYLGFQAAYLISGYTIQSAFFFIVLLVVCELILLPIQFASQAFIRWILHLILPILFALVLIKGTQYVLLRFAFLEDNGKTLAITNRRGFFIMTYLLVFYNIFTGFFSCVMRILKGTVLGVLLVSRLDGSLFPIYFAKYDGGFKYYSSFLYLEMLQSNPILRSFVYILLKTTQDTHFTHEEKFSTENVSLISGAQLARKDKKKLIARNRWFVAVTMIRNPMLEYQRKVYLRSVKKLEDENSVKIINPNDGNDAANKIKERETVI